MKRKAVVNLKLMNECTLIGTTVAMKTKSKSTLLLIFSACFILLFFVYAYFSASHNHFNSDTLQSYNEVYSVINGNILLQNWILSLDNFYFTALPLNLLFYWISNHSWRVIYLAPLVNFLIMIASALFICKSQNLTTHSKYLCSFSLIYLIGFPCGPSSMFLSSDLHIGTITLCLLALLLLKDALMHKHFHWIRGLLGGTLVFFAVASDPFAQIFFVLPFLTTISLQTWLNQKIHLSTIKSFAFISAAAVLGAMLPDIISHHHGFHISPALVMGQFVTTPNHAIRNIIGVVFALRILFSATPAALSGWPIPTLIAGTRLIFLVGVTLLILRATLRAPSEPSNGVVHFLILASVTLFAADGLGADFRNAIGTGALFPGGATRYVTPAFVFLSIAAAVEGARIWSTVRSRLILKAGYAAAAILALPFLFGVVQRLATQIATTPPFITSPSRELAEFLTSHHWTRGISGYWTAGKVQAESHHKIIIAPVVNASGRLVPYRWNTDTANFKLVIPHPQFVAFRTQNAAGINISSAKKTTGDASVVYHVGAFTVVVASDRSNRLP